MARTMGAPRTRHLVATILAVGVATALASTPGQAATSVTRQADLSTVDNDNVDVCFADRARFYDPANVFHCSANIRPA
jgi:hypothetical protein